MVKGNNMYNNNAYNQYKENSVFTASPEELTLMLYNGLVKFLMQARMAIDNNDIQKANNSIIRSQDIIQEFRCTLDMSYEVAQGMALMYDYMYRRLIEANMKKDPAIIDEVLGYAKDFRDTWTEAMKIAKTQQPRQKVASV